MDERMSEEDGVYVRLKLEMKFSERKMFTERMTLS